MSTARHTISAAAVAAAVAAGTLVGPAAHADAARPPVRGKTVHAWQSRVTDKVHVSGYARDVDAPHTSVRVRIYLDGHYISALRANHRSHVGRGSVLYGRHRFTATLRLKHRVKHITLTVLAADGSGRFHAVSSRRVNHRTPKGEKIVQVARRYVRSGYAYGADGPDAFDCSGYTMFVYRKARVARLPHNSESQRHARHMRHISRRTARPGDLVFYMSGGSSYHVAIYAGHGTQYSATNPQRGVEHHKITSGNIQFRSDWH